MRAIFFRTDPIGKIRVLIEDGKVWFVVGDIAHALEKITGKTESLYRMKVQKETERLAVTAKELYPLRAINAIQEKALAKLLDSAMPTKGISPGNKAAFARLHRWIYTNVIPCAKKKAICETVEEFRRKLGIPEQQAWMIYGEELRRKCKCDIGGRIVDCLHEAKKLGIGLEVARDMLHDPKYEYNFDEDKEIVEWLDGAA